NPVLPPRQEWNPIPRLARIRPLPVVVKQAGDNGLRCQWVFFARRDLENGVVSEPRVEKCVGSLKVGRMKCVSRVKHDIPARVQWAGIDERRNMVRGGIALAGKLN